MRLGGGTTINLIFSIGTQEQLLHLRLIHSVPKDLLPCCYCNVMLFCIFFVPGLGEFYHQDAPQECESSTYREDL